VRGDVEREPLLNTLTSSGSGLKQSAFASAFSRIKVVWRRFPFFFPHIAARPLRRVPWGGEGAGKTAQNPSIEARPKALGNPALLYSTVYCYPGLPG